MKNTTVEPIPSLSIYLCNVCRLVIISDMTEMPKCPVCCDTDEPYPEIVNIKPRTAVATFHTFRVTAPSLTASLLNRTRCTLQAAIRRTFN